MHTCPRCGSARVSAMKTSSGTWFAFCRDCKLMGEEARCRPTAWRRFPRSLPEVEPCPVCKGARVRYARDGDGHHFMLCPDCRKTGPFAPTWQDAQQAWNSMARQPAGVAGSMQDSPGAEALA